MSEAPWTIARLVAWATEDFKKRGIETARLEAELLLGEALGLDRLQIIVNAAREVEATELSRYRDLIVQRRGGAPLAYVLGRREFYGREFRVDARVLVPRPDTETLVDVALARSAPFSLGARVLDLCTGSGCVAVTLGRERRTWRVLGVDLSEGALRLAHENAVRLGAAPNVGFLLGDLYAPLRPGARFELITANPPYIPSADVEQLDRAVRDFEPRLALDGGADGLAITRRIVAEAPVHLASGGVLALELQLDQAPLVAPLLEAAGFVDVEVRRDYGGHDRVLSGRCVR